MSEISHIITNGRVGPKSMRRPATYATTNPAFQEIIENSPMFNTRIFLQKVEGADDCVEFKEKINPAVKEKTEFAAPAADLKYDMFISAVDGAEVYIGISNIQEASELLKSKGVPFAKRRSLVDISDYCKANNIRMPDLIIPRRRKQRKDR